jgi:hypothetical protein
MGYVAELRSLVGTRPLREKASCAILNVLQPCPRIPNHAVENERPLFGQ